MGSDEHDDDVTKPDRPGLGNGEDTTSPGVGTGEAYFAVIVNADRAMAALKVLAGACPRMVEAGRERHLEVLAHAHGELGMLHHGTRRLILQLIREEFKR